MPKRILLADDSITIQKVVELTFSDGDYEIITANNGARALQKLSENTPDIILSDIIMPERNGYEVCEYVKSHPEYRNIPVILLTGTFEPFDPDRAEKAGCDAVVTKPFESQALINKVEELIERRRRMDEERRSRGGIEPQASSPGEAPPAATTQTTPWQIPTFTPFPTSEESTVPPPIGEEAPFAADWSESAAPETVPDAPFAEPPFGDLPAAPAGSSDASLFDPQPVPDEPLMEDFSSDAETRAFPVVSASPADVQPDLPSGPIDREEVWSTAPATVPAEEEPMARTLQFPKAAPEWEGEIAATPPEPVSDDPFRSDWKPEDEIVRPEPAPTQAIPMPPESDEPSPERAGAPVDDDLFAAAEEPEFPEDEIPPYEPVGFAQPEIAEPAAGESEGLRDEFEPEAEITQDSELGAAPADEQPFAPAEEADEDIEAWEEPSVEVASEAPEGPSIVGGMPYGEIPVAPPMLLSDDDVDRIARRVVELMSDQMVRNIAWEVIPDVAESVVRERVRELEES